MAYSSPPQMRAATNTAKVVAKAAVSEEARNSAAVPISSLVPSRPSGMAVVICSRNSQDTVLKSAVSIEPGLTTFTRIPRTFSSAAQVRASERTAALLAE